MPAARLRFRARIEINGINPYVPVKATQAQGAIHGEGVEWREVAQQ